MSEYKELVSKHSGSLPGNPLLESDYMGLVAAVIEEYGGKILHLAYFFLRNADKAHDVLQEVSLKILEHLRDFRGENNSSLETWIYHITYNAVSDLRRKERRVTLLSLSSVPPAELERAIGSSKDPDVNNRILVGEIMSHLPRRIREDLILRTQEGFTYRMIGEMRGIPTRTVMTRIRRACLEIQGRIG